MKFYKPEELVGIDLDNINRRLLEHCVLSLYFEKSGWPHEQKTAADAVNLRMRAYELYKKDSIFQTKVQTLRASIMHIINQELS